MQIDEKWQQFSGHMAYQGSLHAAVEAFVPDVDAYARYNERNMHILRALDSLDERRAESAEDDSPVLQELQRIDSKINVLLDIVDRLLVPVSVLPARHPVRFNAIGAVLPENLLPAGATFLLRLYIDTCKAMPLELPCAPGPKLNEGMVFVYFLCVSDGAADGLDRFIFCHHRRKVAEARLAGA